MTITFAVSTAVEGNENADAARDETEEGTLPKKHRESERDRNRAALGEVSSNRRAVQVCAGESSPEGSYQALKVQMARDAVALGKGGQIQSVGGLC